MLRGFLQNTHLLKKGKGAVGQALLEARLEVAELVRCARSQPVLAHLGHERIR